MNSVVEGVFARLRPIGLAALIVQPIAAQPPVPTGSAQLRAHARELLRATGDFGEVCDATPIGTAGTLLILADYSRRDFCNTLMLVKPTGAAKILQRIQVWRVSTFAGVLQDLNGDGTNEVIVNQPLSQYDGAAGCVAVEPIVYTCTELGCVDQTGRFKPVLERRLAAVSKEAERSSDADKERALAVHPCLVMERDKLQRLLGLNPRAGLSQAEQWLASSNPSLRQKAVDVLSDVFETSGDVDARVTLERVTNDADPYVASRAADALKSRRY